MVCLGEAERYMLFVIFGVFLFDFGTFVLTFNERKMDKVMDGWIDG